MRCHLRLIYTNLCAFEEFYVNLQINISDYYQHKQKHYQYHNKMKVKDLVEKMNLTVFCGADNLDREIKGGYVSDLLSDVMGFAKEGDVWVTLQTHKNVMAIASLKELAAIVLVKGNKPEDDTLEAAIEEGIPILGTDKQTFETSGIIYEMLKK